MNNGVLGLLILLPLAFIETAEDFLKRLTKKWRPS